MHDEVVSEVIWLLRTENIFINNPSEVTIDSGSYIKVFTYCSIIDSIENSSNIGEALTKTDYFYSGLASIGDYKISFTLSKGLKPTERSRRILDKESYSEIVENENKWFVSSMGLVGEKDYTYQAVLDNMLTKNYDNVCFVAGDKSLEEPVALGLCDNKVIGINSVYNDTEYPLSNMLATDNAIYEADGGFIDKRAVAIKENDEIIKSAKLGKKILPVPKYSQEEKQWCWAASAQMIGRYVTGKAKSQEQIVKHVKGKRVDKPATNAEMKKALRYAINNKEIVFRN